MPLKEGQILETDEYNFVLVRAEKSSEELIAIQMDILMDQNQSIDSNINDENLLHDVFDLSSITSEDLLKTSSLDLECLNNTSTCSEMDQTLLNSNEIECVAKELIDDVVATSDVANNNFDFHNSMKSCMIDISNFSAKEFFQTQNFNLDQEFKHLGRLDMKLVKMPEQIEKGQKLVVLETIVIDPLEVNMVPLPKNSPIIERRAPKFNKLSKYVSELREFEAELENVSIVKVNTKNRNVRQRKQQFKKLVDGDLDFVMNIEKLSSGKIKKRDHNALKCKKVGRVEPEEQIVNDIRVPINSVKNVLPKYKPIHITEQDYKIPENMSSLRCSYCQKMFITVTGLNMHIKHCPKLVSKLSDLIDESCNVPEPLKSKTIHTNISDKTIAVKSSDEHDDSSISSNLIRKSLPRLRKKLFVP